MSDVFDRARLVEQLGSDAIVAELLVMFTESITRHIAELTAAMDSSDLDAAQHAVHNIKGISGSIYCRNLHKTASVVDRMLKYGQLDIESIEQLKAAAEEFLAHTADG